jgi:hypothetical protein
MLTAPLDSRGYPVCMTRVELACSVSEGWNKLSPEILMRSAVKCGISRCFDYSLAAQEKAGLLKVKIDPIIADLVSQDDVKPIFNSCLPVSVEDPLNVELYDLGDVLGLDPEIEEEREVLENLRFAQESLLAGRIAAETDENADDLDIDHGMILPEEVIEEVAMPAVDEQVQTRRRRKYSCEQLDVLNQEFMKGSARIKNAEIAR